jgi:hypothetical protein
MTTTTEATTTDYYFEVIYTILPGSTRATRTTGLVVEWLGVSTFTEDPTEVVVSGEMSFRTTTVGLLATNPTPMTEPASSVPEVSSNSTQPLSSGPDTGTPQQSTSSTSRPLGPSPNNIRKIVAGVLVPILVIALAVGVFLFLRRSRRRPIGDCQLPETLEPPESAPEWQNRVAEHKGHANFYVWLHRHRASGKAEKRTQDQK